jgi:hypothetical protein
MKLTKILNEMESFNGLMKMTNQKWGRGRDQRSKHVIRDKNPLMVLWRSGEMSVTFSAKSISAHSTTGNTHAIRVTFFPDKNKKDSIKSFAALQAKLNKLDQNQPIPKNVITRTDLKNMKCKVHCTCPDYTYRMEYANTQKNNSNITTSNGEPPVITNPTEKQGMCKHLMRLVQWLTGGGPVSGKVSGEDL